MRACNTGRIHSVESFGTVDGPGIRFVVFFQGCPMRCLYCHNPDTWGTEGGTEMTVDELLAAYQRNKGFYRQGGITATGGEPLLQLPFLTELFTAAKEQGIHTCLDTSGIVYQPDRQGEFDALFAATDLVLLDIKHADPQGHRQLTGQDQSPVLAFARALEPVSYTHLSISRFKYLLEAVMIFTSMGMTRPPPRRMTCFSWSTRSRRPWSSMGISLISSRNRVPLWASSKIPGLPFFRAPVKEPSS